MNKKQLLLIFTFLLTSFSAFADYLTVDKDGKVVSMSAGDIGKSYGGSFDEGAFKQFDSYAKATGGKMGFCPQFEHLPKIMDGLLKQILENENKQQDVVLSLDTTGSMSDEISEVRKNLVKLVSDLAANLTKDIEVSIVLYKDDQDPFIAKLVADLTSDLQAITAELEQITVNGGGDHPEAVLDSLELIESSVHFRLNSNKTIVLIGDAPGHEASKQTGRKTKEVLKLFGKESVSINPILVSNIGFMPDLPGPGFGPVKTFPH